MEIFIMTDQPVTCPHCGARAEIIIEFKAESVYAQLCKCLSTPCQYLFIEQEETFMKTTSYHEH